MKISTAKRVVFNSVLTDWGGPLTVVPRSWSSNVSEAEQTTRIMSAVANAGSFRHVSSVLFTLALLVAVSGGSLVGYRVNVWSLVLVALCLSSLALQCASLSTGA